MNPSLNWLLIKKKTRTESCTTPNLVPRTSSSRPKNIHKIFLVYHWEKKNSRVILAKREMIGRTYQDYLG